MWAYEYGVWCIWYMANCLTNNHSICELDSLKRVNVIRIVHTIETSFLYLWVSSVLQSRTLDLIAISHNLCSRKCMHQVYVYMYKWGIYISLWATIWHPYQTENWDVVTHSWFFFLFLYFLSLFCRTGINWQCSNITNNRNRKKTYIFANTNTQTHTLKSIFQYKKHIFRN